MKWYFACNNKSQSFFPLIKAAVLSALKNTTLKPHFIYDGTEDELTKWLEEKGVTVIYHRVSFYDGLEKHYDKNCLKIASGAFLRCDIPIIEKEDEIVLYTDCDVLFLKDFESKIEPKYFACSTQFTKRNFRDFNTGVMVMNVKKLKESHEEFTKFITQNLNSLPSFDQTAYQIFYNSKNTKLPTIYNHKPYWGIDSNAVILHFHGPKPTDFILEEAIKNHPAIYDRLYTTNPKAYDYYLNLFQEYSPETKYSKDGMEKLKSKVYPLIKYKKTSLSAKIKSRAVKELKKIEQKCNFCK